MCKGKTVYFCLMIALVLTILSCGGSGGGGSSSSTTPGPSSTEITVNGTFGGSNAKSTWYDRALASLTSKAFALNPGLVSKVLVFRAQTHDYRTAAVANGSFSIKVEKGNPFGIIFAGSANEYLGYLTLKNGVESLPIGRVKSGVYTIDLGTLSSLGTVVEPSNNPLDNEVPLTPDEQKILAQFGGLFSSIVKNPDVDGNGAIDFLEGKKYFLEIIYNVRGGIFQGGLTPVIDPQLERYQIHSFANFSNCPASGVTISGPQGSAFENPTAMEYENIGSYCSHKVLSALGNPTPLEEGSYKITYPDRQLTFPIPDQTSFASNIVLITPTVVLEDSGVIQKIKWSYNLANGNPLNPESIITQIQVTLADLQFTAQGLYSSPLINSASTTEIDLSTRNILWDDVGCVNTSYYDVYGNGYTLKWDIQRN